MNTAVGHRTGILILCLVVVGGVGLVSVRNVTSQLAVLAACEAVEAEDWTAVLVGTEGRLSNDDTGRAATECRCVALLATGRSGECAQLLEKAVAAGEADAWAPRPALAIHLIQTWRELARSEEAADLARRAARLHPDDSDLFFMELETRTSVGDDSALAELAARVPERGPHAVRMRVSLANHHLFRGDPASALAVLGAEPPAEAGGALGLWFDTRGMALAANDDLAGVIANTATWRSAGGDPIELEARYALTLSIANLADPDLRPAELLRRALGKADRLTDQKLHEALAIRLILTLANEGNTDEALAVYDRASQRFEMTGLARAEIERSAVHRHLGELGDGERGGSVQFRVPAPERGAVLLVSPPPEAPVDTGFLPLPLPGDGRLRVERNLGTAPLRWVYRDGAQHTLASGTVNLVAGAAVEVAIEPREPRAARAARARELTRHPGDGHRRVTVLLLDCGDWRLIEYLRARGELPTLSALLASGYRAVLDSDPPLTAAALEALVWPNRRGADSFVGLVHRMGVELAGLASVGENPFEALHWVMPEEADLFSVLGAGDRSVANLLLSHGGVRAGRHSEVTGPHGAKRRIPLGPAARDLDAEERRRWPALAAASPGRDRLHVRTIASELDAAEEIVAAADVDLLLLRVEPLDILTHGHFAETVRTGQDDADNLLYEVYRYIDSRLADVHAHTDADDVFIVMSDHGIRTAMEHSRHALFVATGRDIPAGRSDGEPALRGLARVLAELLEVQTPWPDTGIAPFARALASADIAVAAPDAKPDAAEARSAR